MSKFKLIKELGLKIERVVADAEPRNYSDSWSVVRAEDLEALLQKSIRVTAYKDSGARTDGMWWLENRNKDGEQTHTALLIGIEPVKKESAEDVLEDLVNLSKCGIKDLREYLPLMLERAKKVLGK